MAMPLELLSWENTVFKSYVYWTGVLCLKMLAMSLLTGFYRFKTLSFPNPEDVVLANSKVKYDEPSVERIRRAHRNDLENILVFFPVGLLYVLTNPSVSVAVNLFRVFGIARIAHTIVYAVWVIPQPARGLAFNIGLLASGYMALQVILKVL